MTDSKWKPKTRVANTNAAPVYSPETRAKPFEARLPYCTACKGCGVKLEVTRYVPCTCGRRVDSKGAAKLSKQARLDKRLEELMTKGWG